MTIICYKSAFGNYIAELAKDAKAIFVLLNEGWYQKSAGSYQFLSLAKLRAIETRKYIVRSSNFGITSVIDQRAMF